MAIDDSNIDYDGRRACEDECNALRDRISKLEAQANEWKNVVNDGRYSTASAEVLVRAICENAHRVLLAAYPLVVNGATKEEAKSHPSVMEALPGYDAAYAEILKRLLERDSAVTRVRELKAELSKANMPLHLQVVDSPPEICVICTDGGKGKVPHLCPQIK